MNQSSWITSVVRGLSSTGWPTARAPKQIDVLKDRRFEFMFIPLDTIDLTLALDNLREAWRDFESREYVQALVKADEAIAEATASELRLRHEEVNFYSLFAGLLMVMLVGVFLLYWRSRSNIRSIPEIEQR